MDSIVHGFAESQIQLSDFHSLTHSVHPTHNVIKQDLILHQQEIYHQYK